MNKFHLIIFILIGQVLAASSPGPAIPSSFPQFATKKTPSALTDGSVPESWSTNLGPTKTYIGPIRGYRNGLATFLT